MTKYSRVVFSIDAEDIENYDPDFYDWLCKQGDEAIERAIDDLAERLADYFDGGGDAVYDCLFWTKRHLKYDKED